MCGTEVEALVHMCSVVGMEPRVVMTTQRLSGVGACAEAHLLLVQVEDMQRKDLYRRDTLLQKIQGETAKARAVLMQRAALQEARKKVRASSLCCRSV